MREMVIAAVVAIGLALMVVTTTGTVRTYRVQTSAMHPAVPSGTHVLTVRARNVSRGDIVCFRYPREPRTTLIKRVVAAGGETVEIRAKKLFVNGKAVHEPYVVHSDPQIYAGELLPEPYRSRDHFGPYVVPAGHFFLLGDNRDASADSRYWGAVPRAHILSRVVWVVGAKQPRASRGGRLVALR